MGIISKNRNVNSRYYHPLSTTHLVWRYVMLTAVNSAIAT